jgi:CubicO group peptidase (beta-lactamase class C family)
MSLLVLDPLKMTSSTFQQPLPQSLKSKVAVPYRLDGKPVLGGPHTYIEQAAAGLWTTPTDLTKYIISIQRSLQGDSHQILTKCFAELVSIIPESHSPDIQMGLGTAVSLNKYGKKAKKGTYFSHGGENEGYRSLFVADTKQGNGVVIMTNMSVPEGEKDHGWEFIYAIEKKIADINKWK